MKKLAAVIAMIIVLSGCGEGDETYRPEKYDDLEKSSASSTISDISTAAAPSSEISFESKQTTENGTPAYSAPEQKSGGDIVQELISEGGRLIFTLKNVFSDGEYYTVTASAAKTDNEDSGTVYINGEPYGDVSIVLSKDGKQLDTMKLDIPSGDRFIILESAADNSGSSYGCEIISNMREFDAPEYPDVVGLIFRGSSTEAAVPEYARYFAVFCEKLTELPIYENGYKVDPRGAKLEPKSAGLAVQHLTVLKSSGSGYEIVKYEYRFDLENKRLNKQQVKFYGWDY